MVCILFLGSTQLVSKTGLLSKEADETITRMLPLPFPFYFGSSIELLIENMEMFKIDKLLNLKSLRELKLFTAVC